MAGVAGNDFKQICLEAGLNKSAQAEDQILFLFQNDFTPAEDSVFGDFTEADFSGYAQVPLVGTDWTVTSAAPAVASQAEQSFVSDADQTPQTIYGYGIVLEHSAILVGAERFASPQVVQNNGDQIKITPRLRLYTKS